MDLVYVERALRLRDALRGILDIGKRDMSNPKYDGYFDEARLAILSFDGYAEPQLPLKQADDNSIKGPDDILQSFRLTQKND